MLRKIWFSLLLSVLSLPVFAHIKLPVYPDSIFSTYYQQRITHFRTLPKTGGVIIFLGNSITDGAEWNELAIVPLSCTVFSVCKASTSRSRGVAVII